MANLWIYEDNEAKYGGLLMKMVMIVILAPLRRKAENNGRISWRGTQEAEGAGLLIL